MDVYCEFMFQFTALSGCSKYVKEYQKYNDKDFTQEFTVALRTLVSNATLVSCYQTITHSLVECSHINSL